MQTPSPSQSDQTLRTSQQYGQGQQGQGQQYGQQGQQGQGQQYGQQGQGQQGQQGQGQQGQQGQGQQGRQDVSTVQQFWKLIRINKVEHVEIINHQIYQGPATEQLRPGMLGRADVQLTVSAAYDVNPDTLAVRYKTRKFPASKEIRLELGTVTHFDEPPRALPQGQSRRFNVTVPLVCDGGSSILDKINLSDSGQLAHYTITIPGENFTGTVNTCNHYVRLVVDFHNNRIDLKSVNQSYMDYGRAQTSATNFIGWLKGFGCKLKEKAINMKKERDNKKIAHQTGQTENPNPTPIPVTSNQSGTQTNPIGATH